MKKLTDIKKDFPQWYQDVIYQAELVDSSPTPGCFVICPYGYAIWEEIQKNLDARIKKLGAKNAYFPLLIPESFLKKEAEHVEGFAPEVAVVTHAGGKKLEEPFVIRPTSETMMYHMFAKWITSWRDLPLKINQWANVVRWEMRPRAFLRTREFLWHEGHTVHATQEEAVKMAEQEIAMYKEFTEKVLAIPVVIGVKSKSERFAGADETYCIEALMQDGKALQFGTAHLLAHSFPKSFGLEFQDKDGEVKVPYCTSFGVATRMIGGIVMSHGDENGLIIPPNVAPIQVVIIPIFRKDEEKEKVLNAANSLFEKLEKLGLRVQIDLDETKTPGAKFFHWEVRGVPVRIEIGPKDIEKNTAVLVNRAEPERAKKKQFVAMDQVETETTKLLEEIQKQLFARAKKRMEDNWYQEEKIETIGKKLDSQPGFYQTGWCGSAECEATLKPFKGTIRCLLKEQKHKTCFACEKESKTDVLVAKSY